MKECVQWLRETVNHQIKRKTQTKKERMAEMEKAQAFRVEVTLWIVVAAALLLFISNLGFGGAVGKTVSGFLLVCSDLWHMFFRCCFLWAVFLRCRTVEISWQP